MTNHHSFLVLILLFPFFLFSKFVFSNNTSAYEGGWKNSSNGKRCFNDEGMKGGDLKALLSERNQTLI